MFQEAGTTGKVCIQKIQINIFPEEIKCVQELCQQHIALWILFASSPPPLKQTHQPYTHSSPFFCMLV